MRKNLIVLAAAAVLGTAAMTTSALAQHHGGGMGGGGTARAAPSGGGMRGNFGGAPRGNFGAATTARPGGSANFAATNRSFAAPGNSVAARGFDHGHHFRGGGFGGLYAFGGGPYYYGYDYDNGCWQRQLVPTPFGLRWRLIDVCE